MKSSEVVKIFKDSIASTKQSGADSVSIKDLEAYAARLEKIVNESPEGLSAGEANMEQYRANLNAWIIARQHKYEHNIEMLRAVITTGQSALKSALIINGAAAVAMLAFAGRLFNESTLLNIDVISLALLQFVWGVLAAALAAGATYFSQAGYGGEFFSWSQKVGIIGHIIAVLAVFSAYIFFGAGALLTYSAISHN